MKKDIELRVLTEAEFFLKNKCTVREMTRYFALSKSAIHVDLTKRLKKIDENLYFKVDKILKFNYSVKHIRGGNSTRKKYLKLAEKSKNIIKKQ